MLQSPVMILEVLQFLVVSVLSAFLALGNSVADLVLSIVPAPEQSFVRTTDRTPGDDLPKEDVIASLPSSYEYGGAIPDILIRNASYQEAAVVQSDTDDFEETPYTGSLTPHERIRNSLVNVYCSYKTDEYERVTAGSGFFLSTNGVILTNAHVAQFLLLEDVNKTGKTNCIVRAGDPAKPLYEAELLYISPLWIAENASLIQAEAPKGTGERDYALLYISNPYNDEDELPSSFPAIDADIALLPRSLEGSEIAAAGYPADDFYKEGKDALLSPVVASTSILTLYTFGSNYADIFSISDSAVGEHGASGGPVVDANERAIGLIVTKGNAALDGERSLRAITISYIDRTITEETGFGLMENTTGDLPRRAEIFKEVLVPFLANLLEEELE